MNPLHHQEIFLTNGMPILYPSAVVVTASEEEAVGASMRITRTATGTTTGTGSRSNQESQNVVSQQNRQRQQQGEGDEEDYEYYGGEGDEDAGDDVAPTTLDETPPVEINVQSPSYSAVPTEAGGGGDGSNTPAYPPSPSSAATPPSGDGEYYDNYPPRPAASEQGNKKSATAASDSGGDKQGPSSFVWLIVFGAIVLMLLFGYRAYKKYQRKREQYLMNLRSAQADQVLGDMQMVPSEDPDQELL